MIQDEDWHLQYTSLLGIFSLIQIKDLIILNQYLDENMQLIINLFQSPISTVAKLAIQLSCDILDHYPKVGLEADGLLRVAYEFACESVEGEPEKLEYALTFLSKAIQKSSIVIVNEQYQDLLSFAIYLIYSIFKTSFSFHSCC